MEGGNHPYCERHSSYYCPCVRPQMYRTGDPRGNPQAWDDADAVKREKRDAKVAEARAEYEERQRDQAAV